MTNSSSKGLTIGDKDCSYVWQVKPEKRCGFVLDINDCQLDSQIQYVSLLFCSFEDNQFLFIAILILICLWLLYLFLILGSIADNFFCPSLSSIASTLHLSENIAGVTILAFGNGSPDIFTSLVADTSDSQIMFTELIGAGVFVTSIIAGTIAIFVPFTVPLKIFLRDCFFYVVAVCWITYITLDDDIHLAESLGLIALYISFIAIVLIMQHYDSLNATRQAKMAQLQDPNLLQSFLSSEKGEREIYTPMKPSAFGLKTKLDVAIAAELAKARMRGGIIDISKNDSELDKTVRKRPRGLCEEFFYDINPINIYDWRQSNCLTKMIYIVRAPIMLPLQILIPVVNETVEKNGWSKLLNCIQLCLTPIVALFILQIGNVSVGPMPIPLIFFILTAIISILVFVKTQIDRPPKFHFVFAFFGFIVAIIFVWTVANEVLAVLQCIGFASGISNTMLGLTLLAWGNSIGDLISNVAIARQGFPRMGYSACFGGPLFNTLIGLGLSWTIQIIKSPNYHVPIINSDMMPGCLSFLLCSLIISITYLTLTGSVARQSYGFILYTIYIIFLFINFLSEIGFIHPLGTDHDGMNKTV